MAERSKLTNSRIAFTLPISCQICLGKVKQPVVCPNQHVFCSPCMEVWLDRSKHCPACRVPIDQDNPCKKILGGLSQDNEVEEEFSKSKDLRKARVEILYKEYEDEIERLQNEMDTIKDENKVLAEQLKVHRGNESEEGSGDNTREERGDLKTLLALTKKLQDTTSSYEKARREKERLKKENNYLKDENVNLGRESQQLRMELTNRSPRKYGRLAAAAMETKLESYEKENNLLQKALERSDLYVEEMEKELEKYRKFIKLYSSCPKCHTELVTKDDKWSEGSGIALSGKTSQKLSRASSLPVTSDVGEEQPKAVISGTSFYGKRPTPIKSRNERFSTSKDVNRNASELCIPSKCREDSFGLEHPSPSTPSTVMRKLTINTTEVSETSSLEQSAGTPFDNTGGSEQLSDILTSRLSSTESCCKKLRFDTNHPSSQPSTSGYKPQNVERDSSVDSTGDFDDSSLDSKFSRKGQKLDSKDTAEATFEMPSSTSDSDECDPNMTTDIAECMQLLDAAEKKVKQQPNTQASYTFAIPDSCSGATNNSNLQLRSTSSSAGFTTGLSLPTSGIVSYGTDNMFQLPGLPKWLTEIEQQSTNIPQTEVRNQRSGTSSLSSSSTLDHVLQVNGLHAAAAAHVPSNADNLPYRNHANNLAYRNPTNKSVTSSTAHVDLFKKPANVYNSGSSFPRNNQISTSAVSYVGINSVPLQAVSLLQPTYAFASADSTRNMTTGANSSDNQRFLPVNTLSQPFTSVTKPVYSFD